MLLDFFVTFLSIFVCLVVLKLATACFSVSEWKYDWLSGKGAAAECDCLWQAAMVEACLMIYEE